MSNQQKKKSNGFVYALLGFLIVAVVLLIKDSINKSKYDEIENYLLEHYYSSEHLESAIKNTLGDNADYNGNPSEFISENFDNYVFNLILNDINKQESSNIAKYNAYYNKETADKIMNIIEQDVVVEVKDMNDIFYIKIPSFTKGDTYLELSKHLEKMRDYNNFIIDLRGNSGGDITELIDVLSLFYKKDSVVYIEKMQDKVTEHKSNNEYPVAFEKIVFLCDDLTASASEAMIFNMNSDFDDKIEIVGSKTYGKNFCYAYKQFDDGELFMFVSGLMCNSKGETFDISGITPDYVSEGENALIMAEQLFEMSNQ